MNINLNITRIFIDEESVQWFKTEYENQKKEFSEGASLYSFEEWIRHLFITGGYIELTRMRNAPRSVVRDSMYHSIDPHMDEETIELLDEIYGDMCCSITLTHSPKSKLLSHNGSK